MEWHNRKMLLVLLLGLALMHVVRASPVAKKEKDLHLPLNSNLIDKTTTTYNSHWKKRDQTPFGFHTIVGNGSTFKVPGKSMLGMILAFDPKTTEQEITEFFPKEVEDADGYAGCFGVYPRRRVVSRLEIPEETEDHPYFESHELTPPMEETVTKRTAFGTHWGLVYFRGADADEMFTLLKRQQELDFYV